MTHHSENRFRAERAAAKKNRTVSFPVLWRMRKQEKRAAEGRQIRHQPPRLPPESPVREKEEFPRPDRRPAAGFRQSRQGRKKTESAEAVPPRGAPRETANRCCSNAKRPAENRRLKAPPHFRCANGGTKRQRPQSPQRAARPKARPRCSRLRPAPPRNLRAKADSRLSQPGKHGGKGQKSSPMHTKRQRGARPYIRTRRALPYHAMVLRSRSPAYLPRRSNAAAYFDEVCLMESCPYPFLRNMGRNIPRRWSIGKTKPASHHSQSRSEKGTGSGRPEQFSQHGGKLLPAINVHLSAT